MRTATGPLLRRLEEGGSTALLAARGGDVVLGWGDPARRSSVASVRKSLLSALVGIAVANRQISLDTTLAELGVEDRDVLGDQERQATVLHLLQSRSGVNHPAVYGTTDGRPARNTHPPGTFWLYNNWDFNALGTIFRRCTGLAVVQALHDQLALPLSMEDLRSSDGFLQTGPESVHPVYKLYLSARDLLRFGQLYLQEGRWDDRQIVPRSWIAESTRPHSDLGGGRGYGLLWWTATAFAPGDPIGAPAPMFYASGFGGQYVIVVPELELVVVHRAADVDRGITHADMGDILRLVLDATCRS